MSLLLPTRVCAKSLQLCWTLCNPMDGSCLAPRPWDFSGKNTGVGCHALLQGIFPTQFSCNTGGFFTMWAAREAPKHWSVAYPFSRGTSRPRNQTSVSCIVGSWVTREALRSHWEYSIPLLRYYCLHTNLILSKTFFISMNRKKRNEGGKEGRNLI